MRTLILVSLLSSVFSAPAPQEVEVVSTGADGGPVVLVLGPRNTFDFPQPEIPAALEDLGGFPRPGKFPILPASFGEFLDGEDLPEISLSEILNPATDEAGCGVLCRVFKTLEGQLGVIQPDGEGVSSDSGSGKEYVFHNTTSDQKVLPDGTIVNINKTTIHDKDKEGNGFFFHSTVHHVLQEKVEDNEEEDETNISDSVVEESSETELSDDNLFDLSDNEILDSVEDDIVRKFPTLDVTDIESGLLD